MTRLEVSPVVRALCQAAADLHHAELVDVRFGGSGRDVTLEVILDREEAVDLELLTRVSKDLSEALDEDEDLIEGSYVLEVASAGLERPLVKPQDYERFMGSQIKVVSHEAVEGSNQFRGPIHTAGPESFTLLLDGDRMVEIPYEVVKKAHLWVDWDEEMRRAEEHHHEDGDEMPRRRKRKSVGGKR